MQPTAQPQAQPEQPTVQSTTQPQAQPAPQAIAQATPNQAMMPNQPQPLPTQSLQPQPAKANTLDKFKNKKTVAIIAGAVVVVIVLAIAGFFLLQPNKQDYKDALKKADKITDSLRDLDDASNKIRFSSLSKDNKDEMNKKINNVTKEAKKVKKAVKELGSTKAMRFGDKKGLYKKFEKKINKSMDITAIMLKSTKNTYFILTEYCSNATTYYPSRERTMNKIDKCIKGLSNTKGIEFKPSVEYLKANKKMFIKLKDICSKKKLGSIIREDDEKEINKLRNQSRKDIDKYGKAVEKTKKDLVFDKEWKKLYEFLEEQAE